MFNILYIILLQETQVGVTEDPLFAILVSLVTAALGALVAAVVYLYKSREKILDDSKKEYKETIDTLSEFNATLQNVVNDTNNAEILRVIGTIRDKLLEMSLKLDSVHAKSNKSER